MQLRLKRTQREGGVVSKNVIFCLNARAHFTDEERRNLQRYKLWNQVIYNSESAKRSLEKSVAHTEAGGAANFVKGMAHLAITAMKLNISVRSLEQGQYIECKSMDELLGAEDALYTACGNLKEYLAMAATFDGQEIVVDYSNDRPEITAHAPIEAKRPVAQKAIAKAAPAPALAAPVTDGTEEAQYTEVSEEPVYEEESEYSSYVDQSPMRDLKIMVERNPTALLAGFVLVMIFLIFYTHQ